MKKKLAKSATLNDVINAVNDIKHDIHFLRTDSTALHEHINDKINLSESRLKNQAEINHYQIMDEFKSDKKYIQR